MGEKVSVLGWRGDAGVPGGGWGMSEEEGPLPTRLSCHPQQPAGLLIQPASSDTHLLHSPSLDLP